MTEILVPDVNLNSVCERLEQHCCVDQNQHNLSSQPQTPVLKRHSNTGAKLWGRVRSKLLRQKVSRPTYAHVTHIRPVFPLFLILCTLSLRQSVASICLPCTSPCVCVCVCVLPLTGCLPLQTLLTIVLSWQLYWVQKRQWCRAKWKVVWSLTCFDALMRRQQQLFCRVFPSSFILLNAQTWCPLYLPYHCTCEALKSARHL